MSGDRSDRNGVKIGLALGSGGARGFAHLGVAKALRELEVPLHCIAGTSIGAVMGGVIASDMLKRAINWCGDPDWFKLPPLFLRWHLPKRSILGSGKIDALIKSMLCARKFDEFDLPFAAVATDLYSGETVVMRDGDVISAIRGSMAIPGVFEPVLRNGRVLVDGGISNPVPVDVCRRMGAEKVIAVDVNAAALTNKSPHYSKLNLINIIDRTFTIVCGIGAQANLREVKADCILTPWIDDVQMLDFRGVERLIDVGYRYTMERERDIRSLLDGE